MTGSRAPPVRLEGWSCAEGLACVAPADSLFSENDDKLDHTGTLALYGSSGSLTVFIQIEVPWIDALQ